MTQPEPPFVVPPRVDGRAIRDLLALLLLVAGAVGLGFAAFHTDLWLGIAYLSAVAVTAGALLGMER